jgi:hypothetical protein
VRIEEDAAACFLPMKNLLLEQRGTRLQTGFEDAAEGVEIARNRLARSLL